MSVRGVVAAGHPLTAETGVAVLRAGGNAFDAVLAAFFTACAAEPVLASLGGGGFLLAGKCSEQPVVYDFFTQTPHHHYSHPDPDWHEIIVDFGTQTQAFKVGLATIATPGMVRGITQLHAELCSMPLDCLVEPALEHMRQGVVINPVQGGIFQAVAKILTANDGARSVFAATPGGIRSDILESGDIHVMANLAETLELLVREGDRPFYEGDIANQIIRDCQTCGGHLSAIDLKNYTVSKREPFAFRYRDAEVLTNPSPSSGGMLVALASTLLSAVDLPSRGFGSAAHLSLLARAMAFTAKLRHGQEFGTAGTTNDVGHLTNSRLVQRYREMLKHHSASQRGTTHINVIDKAGNIACLTVSNGEGSAYVVPGTGIMLNNMLGEDDVNAAGLSCWPPDRRLSSMMAPTLVMQPGGVVTAMGSGGSNRIRTALLQVLINMVDFGLPIADAVQRPRIHLEHDVLNIENGFSAPVLAQLESAFPHIHHWPGGSFFFGGVHAARHVPATGLFVGTGDYRRGGVAIAIN